MKNINANDLNKKKLWEQDVVIDVRTPEEFNLEHIPWSINIPVDEFEENKDKLKGYENIYIYCNTWNSSMLFAQKAHAVDIETTMLIWWISTWNKKYPTIKKKWALPMMQQVQVAAWAFVLLGIILAWITWLNWFIWISAFVWAWLVFAGSTWYCGLAKVLAIMPRNKIKQQVKTEITWKNLHIKQFEDKNLAHYSYIAISDWEAIVVDPERNPQKYFDYADQHNAKIVWIYETHPHADFASSHLEIHKKTGAPIYISELVGAEYEHIWIQNKDIFSFGSAKIKALFTPWHSPDSFSFLIIDEEDKEIWLCTWDRVFIGDVGRADLRESVWNIKAKQEELAEMMYESIKNTIPTISDQVYILPTHGSWSLCGKWLSKLNIDTLASQKIHNPMLQDMDKKTFIQALISDQPNIPAYFGNSVNINKKWNPDYKKSIQNISTIDSLENTKVDTQVDTRDFAKATMYPIQNTTLIPENSESFVTLVGTLIEPQKEFIVIVENETKKEKVLEKIASIWYEANCKWVYTIDKSIQEHTLDNDTIQKKKNDYMIVDVRDNASYNKNPIHSSSIHIPLEELQNRIDELPTDKKIIPYCGWEYKSGIAFHIIRQLKPKINVYKWPSDIIL